MTTMSELQNSQPSSSGYRFTGRFASFFDCETPKVVMVQNVPLGVLRLLLQAGVIAFVVIYQLWYMRGYQEFAEVEASVTTKVKGSYM